MTTKLDKLLKKIRSQHTQADWDKLAASGPVHLPPICLGLLFLEDVQFANELYIKLLQKEDSPFQTQDSELDAEKWQRMMEKYATHDRLLDKFHAVVDEVNDIRYSAVAVNVLHGIRNKTIPVHDEALSLVESLVLSREALYDEVILLNSAIIAGGGQIPTLCQLPQQPTLTDIRNVLIKSILEVFPLQLLQTSVHRLTDTEFTQLCQNETVIACMVRQGKELTTAYVETTGKKNKFLVEQMFWSQFKSITDLPIAQIRAISQKYEQEETEKLRRRGQQLVDGPAIALYIFTKLSTDISEEVVHKLDHFWRFRMTLCV